jgi:hypothetical protein
MITAHQIQERQAADRRQIITAYIRDVPFLIEERRQSTRRAADRKSQQNNNFTNSWLHRYHKAKGNL